VCIRFFSVLSLVYFFCDFKVRIFTCESSACHTADKSDFFCISVFRAELHQKFPEIIHSSVTAFFARTTAPEIIMPVIAFDQFFFSGRNQLLFQTLIGKFYPEQFFITSSLTISQSLGLLQNLKKGEQQPFSIV